MKMKPKMINGMRVKVGRWVVGGTEERVTAKDASEVRSSDQVKAANAYGPVAGKLV